MTRLAVSTQYRRVTDGRTDGQTDTLWQHSALCAQHYVVKSMPDLLTVYIPPKNSAVTWAQLKPINIKYWTKKEISIYVTFAGWMKMTDSKNDSKNAVSHAMDLSRPHSKLYFIYAVLWVCNEERLTVDYNSCTQNCREWWKMRRREWTVRQETRRCKYTSMVGAGCTRSASLCCRCAPSASIPRRLIPGHRRYIDRNCATWAQTCWRSRQSEGLAGRRWDYWRYCCWSAVE